MNIVPCKKTKKNGASLFRFAGKKIMKFDSLWGGALAENVFLLTNRPENKKVSKYTGSGEIWNPNTGSVLLLHKKKRPFSKLLGKNATNNKLSDLQELGNK